MLLEEGNRDLASSSSGQHGQHQPNDITIDIKEFEELKEILGPKEQPAHIRDLPIATKLSGSGVNFKKGIEGRSSLEISCEYAKRAIRIPCLKSCELRIPCIKKLELQIPRFEIDDRTECLYRNMMALELCHYPSATHICNFILLMDVLIDTEKDVDLLVDDGILFNCLGDNAAIVKMFNNLGLQITPSRSVYHNIGEKLKAHYARRWNHTMVTLKTVYFKDIWTGRNCNCCCIYNPNAHLDPNRIFYCEMTILARFNVNIVLCDLVI
ncbi:hypothetical protein EZV62_009551 [Acer yangbiense]|uniref:Uncharacterized protein n=1 Tax=Acer yangbiense TaxID=1000413 RepID=A0A5C7HZI9_9ROSI|nr:hypothetical protein EZV62_009551 [Acer yangbiense]